MENEKKKAILIVDDTKPIRILLLKRLEKKYNCFLASEPNEGLSVFTRYQEEIGLIISDFEMPGMNGYEFLKRITALNKTVPAIMLSGALNEDRIIELMKLGVQKFFAKPVNINRLVAEIDNIFDD